MLFKVSFLVKILQLGGCLKLFERVWVQFVLTVSRVNVAVTKSGDDVSVSAVFRPEP